MTAPAVETPPVFRTPLPARARALSIGLFTYSTLPRGSVVHTACLADALVDLGHDVTVYALDKDRRGFFRPLRAQLRLVPAAAAPETTAALVRQRAAELASYLIAHGGAHDVHHAQDCLSAAGLLAARAQGRRLTLARTVHHVEAFADSYLARCQERSVREADLCFTVSDTVRRDVQHTFGVDSVVVGNGVDTRRFSGARASSLRVWRARLGPGAPVVLTVGGVEERKNTRRTLGAFARLRARWPQARLWILGGATVLDHGAYRAEFDRARDRLPPETQAAIVELGVVGEADVPALFGLADVLAMPSLHEGFGLAALEALAAGLPLVASARAPFTGYLDETCAVLVDPLSEEAIAAGLGEALAASPARREAGRLRAEAHSWARVAARHAPAYASRTGDGERTAVHA
jgi:glycosyltransferase-like protein